MSRARISRLGSFIAARLVMSWLAMYPYVPLVQDASDMKRTCAMLHHLFKRALPTPVPS